MSTYWSRQFAIIDYPLQGFRGVGLFSYLYHEYVPAMAAAVVQGQGATWHKPDALMRVKAMADATARGLTLAPFASDCSASASAPVSVSTSASANSNNASEWTRVVSTAFFSFAPLPSLPHSGSAPSGPYVPQRRAGSACTNERRGSQELSLFESRERERACGSSEGTHPPTNTHRVARAAPPSVY